MVGTIVLTAALVTVGQHTHVHGSVAHHHASGGRITPPGPGYGWGFPNGNPDGYGWVDYGTTLPLGANRTGDYFFRRQITVPADELFFPTYYNPYVSRGQRYIPYVGCGGDHPAGGRPLGSAELPMYPGRAFNTPNQSPVNPPPFSGVVEQPGNSDGGR